MSAAAGSLAARRPGDRGRRVHRQPRRRGRTGRRRHVRAFCLYNSIGSAGWLDESTIFADRPERGPGRAGARRHPRRRARGRPPSRGVDMVLHLAALIAIPYSYVAPRSYVETNVTGTLQRARGRAPPRHARGWCTPPRREVYGTPETVPITEAHAAARAVALQRHQDRRRQAVRVLRALLRAPRSSIAAPLQHLRAAPVGPRGHPDRPRPAARRGRRAPARARSPRSATSPIVTDTVRRLRARRRRPTWRRGRSSSSAPGRTLSIGEVVDMCLAVTGSSAAIVTEEERVRPAGSRGGGAALGPEPGPRPARLGARTVTWRPACRRPRSGSGRASTRRRQRYHR